MLLKPVRWTHLQTPEQAETWIYNFDRALQEKISQADASGCGVCFSLAEGGDIFLHTTQEGVVVLDVTPEAQWAAPVIAAAVNVAPPATQVWHFPDDKLIQFVLGLSSLVETATMVLQHDFNWKKKRF